MMALMTRSSATLTDTHEQQGLPRGRQPGERPPASLPAPACASAALLGAFPERPGCFRKLQGGGWGGNRGGGGGGGGGRGERPAASASAAALQPPALPYPHAASSHLQAIRAVAIRGTRTAAAATRAAAAAGAAAATNRSSSKAAAAVEEGAAGAGQAAST